jgi:hypothetical protein
VGPIDTNVQEERAMCTDHHDGSCTATLSRSATVADQLEMKLVCERCDTVLKVLGSFEHKFQPLLDSSLPVLSHV